LAKWRESRENARLGARPELGDPDKAAPSARKGDGDCVKIFGKSEKWWSQTESNRRPLQCH
jgi:hypothetical protein